MTSNNFDFIAPYYDRLAKLIFRGAIMESQVWLLDKAEEGSDVLILGGGTGKVIGGISKRISISYLEKSARMIELSKWHAPATKIEFIQCDFFQWPTKHKWDYILCPFFLDCFGPSNLSAAIQKCKDLLKQEGKLLVADFEQSRTPHALTSAMHLFFRLVANLESKQLANIHSTIVKNGFEEMKEKFFHREMIFSRVYGNL